MFSNKNNKKNIIFPENEPFLFPFAKLEKFTKWDNVIKKFNESHAKLLDGDLEEEPEG